MRNGTRDASHHRGADELLIVAGEASGDRAAARVLRELADVRAFGLGGSALEEEGAELVADLRDVTALGVGELGGKIVGIKRAFDRVISAVKSRNPRAALLVNYTEFNVRVAAKLKSRGVPVLWYGAPQVWAWRPKRTAHIRERIDRMAVMLPFEEELWRRAGVDAHYVGHPAREAMAVPRDVARDALGITHRAWAIAVLPGSRPHEVRSLLIPMLEACERLRHDHASVDARVVLASSLDEGTASWARAQAKAARVETVSVAPLDGACELLRAFDLALTASGTASLEAVLARAIPVVAYRVGLATELVARAFLNTKHVALPNVLLGKRVFSELLQRNVTPAALTAALTDALERRTELLAACDDVERVLGDKTKPSREVADMIAPWLRRERSTERAKREGAGA